MPKKIVTLALMCMVFLPAVPDCTAQVDWTVMKTLELTVAIKDMKVSRNGQWIYVVTQKGNLRIYSSKGDMVDTIEVGDHVDRIEVGPSENTLYLQSNEKQNIRILDLTYVREIDISHSPFKGKAGAPVTIVYYTDFQCAYCAKLLPVLDQLLDLYPDKIKIVYKNYPLRRHRFAFKAAVAAMAAHEKGKFWEFHHRLFENYKKINDQLITDIRKTMALDSPDFDTLVKSSQIKKRVQKDLQEGNRIGVRGTPAVFVNGKRLKNRRLEGFCSAIDKELKLFP